ncbi:MAG: AraC-type DNA-binding protein [Firmicutes bacterium]|nr:AraC-type DNA-binding protein [Bacillota bacterium]
MLYIYWKSEHLFLACDGIIKGKCQLNIPAVKVKIGVLDLDKWELDNFLRRFTPFEEALRTNRDIQALKPLVQQEDKKKYPTFEKRDVIDNILNNPSDGNAKLAFASEGISFCCHPRFLKTAPHSHSFIEMIYVYSGQCRQVINDTAVTMQQGQICIIDTNVHHQIEPAGENDIFINCLMSRTYLKEVLIGRLSGNDLFSGFFAKALDPNNDVNNYMVFSSEQSEKVRQLMLYLLAESFDRSLWSDEVINSYMVIILSELLKIYTESRNNRTSYIIKEIKLSDLILYIQEHCNDATLESVAEMFHFNSNYLSRMLKQVTGFNFTDILHEARLKKACMLLNNSNIAVAKVANAVGYQNVNFFYQIFKKQYGITPAKFRRENSN